MLTAGLILRCEKLASRPTRNMTMFSIYSNKKNSFRQNKFLWKSLTWKFKNEIPWLAH